MKQCFSRLGPSLEEAVADARAATGVPGVAAGLAQGGTTFLTAAGELVLDGGEPVRVDTPFRIASITKPFTATLAARSLELDDAACAFLSHTAGLRPESDDELPAACRGLWSYSNAGYWAVGSRIAAAAGSSFEEAMRSRVLDPLGLGATGFQEPAGAARGHVQEGETGHRAVPRDAYPVARRPSGGLWSTVGDLLRFGEHHVAEPSVLHEPRVDALGARYALGWWVRDLDGRTALDHEGSVGGYQSLLLLVPAEDLVLAVLTNSWRGSGLIRRLVAALGLAPRPAVPEPVAPAVAGRYALDDVEAEIEVHGDALEVTNAETDPVTGARLAVRYRARPLHGGVYGFAGGGLLQSHRLDFPRAGVARVGWTALPRVES
jgi:CubicO group peptidase (beta-lactamase class C family)